ncbi:LOW QUALITY PROTEIN: uncharacterized protein [Palaemon carinicauda]|uniref:LOW QUALITY PROTEIN: uncharacterized protein n=1 Tax=Palaemon carinicauda TaxID=392227 RepID=UPI0035B664CB
MMPLYSACLKLVCAGVVMVLMAGNGVEGIKQKRRKTALKEGDILIGALFSVHQQPKQKTAFTLTCGKIREQYGIQRVEAAFLAIDQINANQELLPNITLGVEIRDSCWYSSIALEQSIEFIRDALAPPDSGNDTKDSCSKAVSSSKHLVGVVGPGSSDVTIQVQNLLQLFGIPQVGYSATSRDLSDKSRFSYFMRVVPSDYYQAQVMVDFVRHYNWTYVSVVHTDGNYGQSGVTAFRELAEQSNICIAKEDSVLSNAEDDAFDQVIHQLLEDQKANVVVCFCEGMTVHHLLLAAQRHNVTSRFLFIGSDGWADRSDVVEGVEEAALGGLSIKIHSPYIAEFDDYYFDLHPDNNTRNPWFVEFWQMRFNCSLPGVEEVASLPRCTGNESLRNGFKQETKMAFVMKAIYTMAWGLHNMQQDLCKNTSGLCSSMLPINGSLYRDYLMNVTFSYMNETVAFDSRGDPPGRYDIMNYQRLENGSFDYVLVGTWDNGTLVVHEERVVFNRPYKLPPASVCSEPCSYNEFKSFVETGDDTQRCCWICIECEEDEFLMNETTCQRCQQGYWPNQNKTGCEAIEVKYILWNDEESIAALCLATLGMLATLFAMIVFIKHNHTPIVKASTRELSYIIFVGMMVSYCATLPLLARPSPSSCALARVLPGLSFAMIYAALVTKTNRIARILAGTKKIMMRKPRFMSATAQVVITCILISIEAGIITTMLILDRPDVMHIYPKTGEVHLVCNTSPRGIIAPMGWDFFLIAMCTVYAIKTRNLPENFNEAKFIGFSMYTTCVIWMAWVPIYFGSDHKIICMSVCTSLSALVILVLLFFPKIYIILLRPEKNDRSAFKTTTNVRCHIGSASKASLSRTSDRSPSAAIESMYVGSAMLGIAQPQLSLMQRIRSTLGMPFMPAGFMPRDSNPKGLLKREMSLWSDASGSGNATNQTREIMLKRAYGSQLDLTADGFWSREERSSQTTDDLLDPLIPRLRRRVARAVREKSLDIDQGREFFTLTHSWMSSQAEAARNEMNRNDSEKSSGGKIITTIIREDVKEEPAEAENATKEGKVGESANAGGKSDKEEEGGEKEEEETPQGMEKVNESKTESVTKDPPHTPINVKNGVSNPCVVSEDDVVQKQSDCKIFIDKSGCDTTEIVGNHCAALSSKESVHKVAENTEKLINGSIQTLLDRSLPNASSTQVVNFIGYGSALPCDPTWKKQRSVSCDNGVIHSSSDVLSVENVNTKECLQRSHGWIPNGETENFLLTSKDRCNGSPDSNGRRRKVGVSAKVSDIRGILKSGSLTSVDKDNRVSFDSEPPESRLCNEERVLSPVSSEDGAESNCYSVKTNVAYQNMAFTDSAPIQSSKSEKSRFRILEEALSAESDADMSDNCELKTIIIRLGSDDNKDCNSLGATGLDKSGHSINWRPKLGRNHKLLSCTSENLGVDNPTASSDTELNYLKDSHVNTETDNSRKYASERELVILDILQSTVNQRCSPLGPSIQCSSLVPSVQAVHQDSKTSDDLSPVSLKSFTISPPENYRNSPTVLSRSNSTDDTTMAEQCCSGSALSPNCMQKLPQNDSNHNPQAYRCYQDTAIIIDHPIQGCSDCSMCGTNFSETSSVPQNDRLKMCCTPAPPVSSSVTPQCSLCTIPQQHQCSAGQGCEGRVCGFKSADIKRVRTETDDDTDESTTPLKEYFRTQGVEFDATSTKSKKL